MARDFSIDVKVLTKARIIVAWYGQEDYEGSAFVLFRQDGKLYEVHGSHCSCYGLEDGGWDPEETSIDALDYRLTHGYFFSNCNDGDVAKAMLTKYVNRRRKVSKPSGDE